MFWHVILMLLSPIHLMFGLVFCPEQAGLVLVTRWRSHYNQVRPHSALGNIAPEAFVRQASALGSCLDLP